MIASDASEKVIIIDVRKTVYTGTLLLLRIKKEILKFEYFFLTFSQIFFVKKYLQQNKIV